MPTSTPTSSQGSLRLGHAADSQLRWVLADVAALVEEARVDRDLSPLAAIGLGQMMAAAAMLMRLTAKRPLRMLLEAGGDGPLGRVRAEADTLGHLRGLVANRLAPQNLSTCGRHVLAHPPDLGAVRFSDALLGSNDPSPNAPSPDAVQSSTGTPELGTGTLRVVRHSGRRNYESKVALVPGGVARNVAHYLETSEQIQSAVLLGVQAKTNGIVAGGGLIVQAMPDADPRVVRALESRLSSLPGASLVLAEKGPPGLLQQALGEFPYETLHEAPLTLSCDCDRERFRDHIRTLAQTQPDVVEPFDDTRVQCSFCGAEYVFEPTELSPTVN